MENILLQLKLVANIFKEVHLLVKFMVWANYQRECIIQRVFRLDKLNESRTNSCQTLAPAPIRSKHVDFDLLRSSMTGDASQVCVFGTGLYEAKKRRKASFKIDASQAGSTRNSMTNDLFVCFRSWFTFSWSLFSFGTFRTSCHQTYHAVFSRLCLQSILSCTTSR